MHRSARRQGPDRARRARGEGAGDQASRRRLPRVRRRARRPRHGDPHRRQRQDAALQPVQHDGDAARARRRSPRACCRRCATIYAEQGRRAARRRALARAGAGDEGRDRGGLVRPNTSRRSSPCASSTSSTRRSRTSRSYGSQHTDAIVTERLRQRDALPARGRFELGDGQRVDALRRRLRVRARRRDRHLDQQAACARAGRASRD